MLQISRENGAGARLTVVCDVRDVGGLARGPHCTCFLASPLLGSLLVIHIKQLAEPLERAWMPGEEMVVAEKLASRMGEGRWGRLA